MKILIDKRITETDLHPGTKYETEIRVYDDVVSITEDTVTVIGKVYKIHTEDMEEGVFDQYAQKDYIISIFPYVEVS